MLKIAGVQMHCYLDKKKESGESRASGFNRC